MSAKVPKFQGFVERAERILAEINQIFVDAKYWNTCVRGRNESLIDPDPGGQLQKAKTALENFLKDAARPVRG